MLGPSQLRGLESLSWADYIGMQNSVIQEEIQEHRYAVIFFSKLNKPVLGYFDPANITFSLKKT